MAFEPSQSFYVRLAQTEEDDVIIIDAMATITITDNDGRGRGQWERENDVCMMSCDVMALRVHVCDVT